MVAQAAITVEDQTPTEPLVNPTRDDSSPRYLSGIGSGDSFTVFYEDRDNGSTIASVATTTGATGFPAADSDTNIADTHFLIKDWPINVGGTDYAYRAWASVTNNANHHFYVSNDLAAWTLVSTFTIPNAASFTDADGFVYYGFHDVIQLNGTYYAFAEANSGETMIVRSANGDDVWEAFDKVGGNESDDGPLEYTQPWTPTGSFFELDDGTGYGKLHVPGDDSAIYIAVNLAAVPGMDAAALEAAFIDPANWTWEDGTTGVPTTPLLSATAEHGYSECWLAPRDNASDPHLIIYTADYGSDGSDSLGYATLLLPQPPDPPPAYSDPAISKAGLPEEAVIGEAVTWTLDIWNPGGTGTLPLTIRDTIPPMFDIVSVTTSIGFADVSGQLVTITTGALVPGESGIVTIQTVVNESAEPGEVCNSAVINENGALIGRDCVTLFPGELPDTGGAPGSWLQSLFDWLGSMFRG